MTSPYGSTPTPPSRLDLANVAAGTVVSAVLVALLGFGVIAAVTALTPDEEGASIGGGILATAGSLLGVALAAVFTAWRSRRRGGPHLVEGGVAGVAGFLVATAIGAVVVAGYLYVARGTPPYFMLAELLGGLLTLLPLAFGAAVAGAAIGGFRGTAPRSPDK